MVFMAELEKMKMKSHHVYVFHHVSGTAGHEIGKIFTRLIDGAAVKAPEPLHRM